MVETQTPRICPKCGGAMIGGRLVIPMERTNTQMMNQLTPGFGMGGLPTMAQEVTSEPRWEEKTGEKTGFIFKRDEVQQRKLDGYRCKLCNYLELYVLES